MVDRTSQAYNDPNATPSSIGSYQYNWYKYERKALIEAKKKKLFGQLSSTVNMPKHFGKRIVKYMYLPVLSDANVNTQGIDALGNAYGTTTAGTEEGTSTIIMIPPGILDNLQGIGGVIYPGLGTIDDTAKTFTDVGTGAYDDTGSGFCLYGTADHVTSATAITNAEKAAASIMNNILGLASSTYAVALAAWKAAGGYINESFKDPATTKVDSHGNLSASSKDVGAVVDKMPALDEFAGRVNRVGVTRINVEGTMSKYGFFSDYTKESMDFDTDAERDMHLTRELVNAASELCEKSLQVDLLNSPGIVYFTGAATSTDTIQGGNAGASLPTFDSFQRLNLDLDNNRCPKDTKLITGTRMIDTKTVNATRYMYVGSEMVIPIKNMQDNFGKQAFISVEKYASGTEIATGEIGIIDQFKIILNTEMMHWEAAGEEVATVAQGTDKYRTAVNAAGEERYNVYPLLVVGSESFTTIGFETDGKSTKFKIKHVKPESNIAYSHDDPYGEKGFTSIKWYYGFLLERPERIALMKCAAPL